MKDAKTPPKVFISYSWSSPEHEAFVLELAEKLVTDGINVILDKWDLKEGHDKYAFMEKMVTDTSVKKVLVISDKLYADKADDRKGGVGTESQIISPEVYNKVAQEKFIPIVTEIDENGDAYLPTFMKGRIYIDLSREDKYFPEYEKLVRNIYDKPAIIKPNLGTPPTYITSDTPKPIQTLHKFNTFRDAITREKPFAVATSKEYLETLLDSLDDFRIETEKEDFDEDIVNSIRDFKPYRDEFVEYLTLICRYSISSEYFDQLFSFFEKAISYKYPPKTMTTYNELWFDNYRFILMELFLYFTAILIKNKKFDVINTFLEEKYYFTTNIEKESATYTEFNEYIRSIDEYRKKRLNLNRISITADILKERDDVKNLDFEELMQTDFILCLRSILPQRDRYHYWFPRSLVYKVGFGAAQPFDIFFRAESPRHFETLKRILVVDTKEELISKLDSAYKMYNLDEWRFDFRGIPFKSLMNIDRLYDR